MVTFMPKTRSISEIGIIVAVNNITPSARLSFIRTKAHNSTPENISLMPLI
jgi:hypothetical protein